MKDQLTTTSYAVLAQVAVRPWSTYELAQQRVRYFRYVWPRAESAIYREAKRLSSMGLIEGKKEYTGKRARTVYSITEEGKEALREWLGTPISPFSMDFEAMLRLFVAPLGTKDDIIRTLKQVRADTQEMLEFAGEGQTGVHRRHQRHPRPGLHQSPCRRLLHQPLEHRRGMGRTHPRRNRDLGRSPALRGEEHKGPGEDPPTSRRHPRRGTQTHRQTPQEPDAVPSPGCILTTPWLIGVGYDGATPTRLRGVGTGVGWGGGDLGGDNGGGVEALRASSRQP